MIFWNQWKLRGSSFRAIKKKKKKSCSREPLCWKKSINFENVCFSSDETTRHHYYLQLRDNVVRHGGGVESLHPHHPLHATSIVAPLLALAGLALQADLGDYAEERHRPHAGSVGYCKPSDYLPPHVRILFLYCQTCLNNYLENYPNSRYFLTEM